MNPRSPDYEPSILIIRPRCHPLVSAVFVHLVDVEPVDLADEHLRVLPQVETSADLLRPQPLDRRSVEAGPGRFRPVLSVIKLANGLLNKL